MRIFWVYVGDLNERALHDALQNQKSVTKAICKTARNSPVAIQHEYWRSHDLDQQRGSQCADIAIRETDAEG